MNFLYPGVLYALAAVAIPVIIHLFHFRRYRKIYFTNVQLLQEVTAESYSRTRLKHLLVLFARMLAIIALVFAFAQPYIPVEHTLHTAGESAVSIYIDNSFSMDATGGYGRLLEEAMEKARAIASSCQPNAKLMLLTNDFDPSHHRFYNRDDFLMMMEKVYASPAFRTASEVMLRQSEALSGVTAHIKTVYLISDFRLHNTDVDAWRPDSNIRYILAPVSVEQSENLSVDSCWFYSPLREPGKPDKVSVQLTNHSREPHPNVQVKLLLNGQQKSLANLPIGAGESVQADLPFTLAGRGMYFASLIVNDNPVTFDDTLRFFFDISVHLRLLCITDTTTAARYLSMLFSHDDYFTLDILSERAPDYSALPQYHAVFLIGLHQISSGMARELDKYVRSGGTLVIFPPMHAELESYRQFLSAALGTDYYMEKDTTLSAIAEVNTNHPLFEAVFDREKLDKMGEFEKMDLPVTRQHLRLSKHSRTTGEPLMLLENGDVFLSRYPAGNGFAYLFAVPLDEICSNFPVHAIFVPVAYRIALLSPSPQPLYYTIGRDEVLDIRSSVTTGDKAYYIRGIPSGTGEPTFQFIPKYNRSESGAKLSVHGQVKESGFFLLTLAEDTITGFAFNYDRRESALEYIPPEEIEKSIKDRGITNVSVLAAGPERFSELAFSATEGKKLWKLCIIFSLAFFAAETLLLRLWK